MTDMEQIHKFAIKWLEKFKDPNTSDIEVGEHYMGVARAHWYRWKEALV